MKDWPLLLEAVDAKLEDQAGFVQWWKDNVREKGGEGGYRDNAERGYRMSVREAEELGSISQQQEARWKASLRASDKYRERLIQAAFRKAGLEPEQSKRRGGMWAGNKPNVPLRSLRLRLHLFAR